MKEGAAEERGGLLAAPPSASLEQEVPVLTDTVRPKPWWTLPLLVAAVVAVSSAATVFVEMREVPPLSLAAWRLQSTSVLLGIGAVAQLQHMPPADRRRLLGPEAGLLAGSGAFLAVHFGTWVYSTQATSLAHSLLFVSATPLFLAAGAWAIGRPTSATELGGTAVGLLGGIVLATAAARSDAQATLAGDAAALVASMCFVGYLLIGRRLRSWMPAFVYAGGVTGLAALLLSLGALAFEGASLTAAGRHGVLGWAASTHYLPLIGYLAVGPGIVGHTGFNTLLRHLDPLIVSLACNLEPLIGSLLGYAAGVVPPPGAWTYLGGALIMLSTAVVSLASHRREQRQRQQEQQVAAGKDGGGSAAAAAAAADGEEAPLVAATAAAADMVRPPWRSDSAAEGSWGRLPGQPEQQRGALPPDRPSVP